MNKSMVEYANILSGESLENFLIIIEFQYEKFLEFYKLVNNFSEHISSLKYSFKSETSLDIIIVFYDERNIKNIKKEIKEEIMKSKYKSSVDDIDSLSLDISLLYNEK